MLLVVHLEHGQAVSVNLGSFELELPHPVRPEAVGHQMRWAEQVLDGLEMNYALTDMIDFTSVIGVNFVALG